MRSVPLALALLALLPAPSAASNAPWSDPSLLEADTFHGPHLQINGPVEHVDLVGSTFVAKSVMTGTDSFYPASLPSTLKVPHLVPDSTHPDLAFWYTPDAFERDGVADGAKVSEWPNIANICHDKHEERVRTLPLGTDFDDRCTTDKVANSQAVPGGNNVYVAKLGQALVPNQPIYKKNIVNGHGVVRFTRGDAFGASGQFLEMTQRCTDYTCAAADPTAGFAADVSGGTNTPLQLGAAPAPGGKGITAFMVVKTAQSTTDVNPMGIMHLNANTADKQGAAIYATETRCIPTHYGIFPTGSQNSTAPPFLLYFEPPGVGANTVNSPPTPSAQVGRYNGMTLNIFGGTADAETNVKPLSHVCTIAQYLFSSVTVVAITGSPSVVTVKGGSGTALGGITLTNAMHLRIGGTAVDGTVVQTLAISSWAVNPTVATNTDITLGTAVTGNFPIGTPVWLCQSATVCTIFTVTSCWDFINNAVSATASTAISTGPFEIRSTALTGAPNCPEGKIMQFSTYTGYIGNSKDDSADNGCYTECSANGGCNLRKGDYGAGNTCVEKQGTTRQIQDTNKGFKVLAVQINPARTQMNAYINGYHEGCDFTQGINGCAGGKITPPVKTSPANTSAQTYALLRFGALAVANAAPNASFANMDVAEIMLYQDSLTPEEMDRVGSYLAGKFGIDGYVVNDDIRSPYRTKAVDKSAGCGSTLRKVHNSVVCKGQTSCKHVDAAGLPAGTLQHNVVSLSAGVADLTAKYYLLMRLTINGGASSIDGKVKSANGQTCVITAYNPAGSLATCDLTRSFEFGYVAYGTTTNASFWDKAVVHAVELASTDLFVSWAPADRVVPFIALLGDMGTPGVAGGALREAVWVTDMSIQGTLYKLTVTRAVAGTAGQVVTNVNALAKDATARLNYPRAVVMSSSLVGDVWLVVSALTNYVTLPTPVNMTNWYARISNPVPVVTGTHEVVQVTQANTITFVTFANITIGDTIFTLQEVSTSYRYEFALLAGDKLRLGNAASGEEVVVQADVAAATGGAHQWAITTLATAQAWPAGTVVTLLERKGVPTPAAIKVVRGRESGATPAPTTAATDHTVGTPIDFMYLPQGETASGLAWVDGSGVSTYILDDCDTLATPFDRDAPIQTFTGPGYIKTPGSNYGLGSFTADTLTTGQSLWYSSGVADSSTGGAVGPAAGGQMVVIKGWDLMPVDQNIAWAANSAVDRYDVTRLENYLKVTVGQRPAVCRDPTIRKSPCVAGSTPYGEYELKCQIVETGAGHCANDWTKACRCVNVACADCTGSVCNMYATYPADVATYYATQHFWARNRKPTIHCEVPPTLGANNQDLNIYWHGIKTTLSNWYKPGAPVINSVVPARANYMGGETITINGYNFGPKISYVVTNEGNARTVGERMSHVEVFGKSFASRCTKTTYVSDKQILCQVPMLPARKVAVDKNTRTVEVGVVVNAEGSRSAQTSLSILTYTSVPTYFACEYKSTSEAAKRDCFTCCRSACIVDEFAEGGVKGGSTFSHCDASCYSYCGYTS